MPPADVELIYVNCKEDFNKASAALVDMMSETQGPGFDFLYEMFESLSHELVEEVFQNCEGDLSKATACLLEICNEDVLEQPTQQVPLLPTSEGPVGRRRASADMIDLLLEAFPHKTTDEVTTAFRMCGDDLILTIRNLDQDAFETPQTSTPPKTKPLSGNDFPSLVPSTRSVKAGSSVW